MTDPTAASPSLSTPPSAPPRVPRAWLLAGGAALAAALGTWWVVGRAATPAPAAAEAPRQTPWLEGDAIHYPPAFAEAEKLSLVAATEAELTPTLHVTGTVTYDARRVAAVGARISGRVQGVHKVEGERVKAGEAMADLESVELGRAQAEVLKARAHEQVARADEAREVRLAEARVSAERDAEHARAHAAAMTAERVAAVKAVEALGGSADGELGALRLRSPLDGRVVEAKVRRGQTVQPSDTLFVVADLSRVWVELAVFERELLAVREGDAVVVRAPSDASLSLEGRVAHVGDLIDPVRRTATVRVEVDNPSLRLKPGLSVVATIQASGPRQQRLVVPRQAVTRVDGKPTVFVGTGPNVVQPRVVELGAEDAERVAVLAGLKPGEKVVVGGLLALKSEVFR